MSPPDPAVLLPPSWSTELCGPWGWNRRDRQGRGKGLSDVACSARTQSWHPWVCQLPKAPTLCLFPFSCLFSLFVAAASEFPFGAPLTQLPSWGSASPLADHLWPFLGSWASCTSPSSPSRLPSGSWELCPCLPARIGGLALCSQRSTSCLLLSTSGLQT